MKVVRDAADQAAGTILDDGENIDSLTEAVKDYWLGARRRTANAWPGRHGLAKKRRNYYIPAVGTDSFYAQVRPIGNDVQSDASNTSATALHFVQANTWVSD